MKKVFLVLAFSLLALGDAVPEPPRYTHIQGVDGTILATIDRKSGEIDYKESCEKVVPVILSFLKNTVTEYQKALDKAEGRKKSVKKRPKKK